MSEQQTQKGKLRRLPNLPGQETYEKLARQIMEFHANPDDYGDFGWGEDFREMCFDVWRHEPKYAVIGGVIYEVLEMEEVDGGFCELYPNDDGTVSYLASWYNGGACLEEVLEKPLAELYNYD